MPDPQNQSAPASVSDDTLSSFMSLDEGKQRDVLGKMSPETKQALLTGLQTRRTREQSATPNESNSFSAGISAPSKDPGLIPPPSPQGDTEWMGTKLARGAEMGVAKGLGIPTDTTDPSEVVTGALSNAAGGIGSMVKSAASYKPRLKDEDGKWSPEGIAYGVAGPLGPSVMAIGKGIYGAGREAWKGLKDSDPEAFAEGFANAATQILSMAELRKGKLGGEVKAGARQAKLTTAIGGGAENFANLEKAMPQIVEQAKSAGVHDLKGLGKVVKDAHETVNDKFNNGFAPIANKPYLPVEISRAIKSLITPDLLKDFNTIESIKAQARAKGATNIRPKVSDAMWKNHDLVEEMNRQAREYERPWTLKELNAKRMNMNEELSSHYNKDSAGQAADPMGAHIKEAIRDKAADIVYGQWDQANPGQGAQALKQQHGALWNLDDAINGKKGAINATNAREAEFAAGGGRMGALRPGITLNVKNPMPHGYFAGLADALFRGGPMNKANKLVRGSFQPSLTSRAARLGVLGFPAASHLTPPPTPDEQ